MGADDTGGDGTRAFELFAEETRVDALRALAERQRERPADPALSFSELRKRVGERDSGNFNYHLSKLRGRYVRKTDAGYRLTGVGTKVVGAVSAGVFEVDYERGPTPLDHDCFVCGQQFSLRYADGVLRVDCPDGHRVQDPVPPAAVEGRSTAECVELLSRVAGRDTELVLSGTCPLCYGDLDRSLDPDPPGQLPPTVGGHCDQCGAPAGAPVAAGAAFHPAVIAFYHDHGVDVRAVPHWSLSVYDAGNVDRISGDPPRFRVAVVEGDGELAVVVDETASVVGVERTG